MLKPPKEQDLKPVELRGSAALAHLGMGSVKEHNESEKKLLRIASALEAKPEKLEMLHFNVLDNNLIDSVYCNVMTIQKDKLSHAGDDLLAEQELLFHLRKITKELEFLAELPFVTFWAYAAKVPEFMGFLDGFLQNIRKYNDLEKLHIDLDQSVNLDSSKLSCSGEDVQKQLKLMANKQLKLVFKIFYRLSRTMESGTEYFGLEFYRGIVYDYQLFDIAKLLDIAAIYGTCNDKIVKALIEDVIELEPRFAADFKDSFDMMVNMFKRIFRDAQRTDQMIKGDTILQKSRSEQDEIILLLLQDAVEILSNFQLIVDHFGQSVLDQVSNTNFMVLLTNAYCMARKIRKFWIGGCQTKTAQEKAEYYIQNIIKLTIKVLAAVLRHGVLEKIGQHTKNYAVVQNKLAATLKSYIMIINDVEMSKDVMPKQINYITYDEDAHSSQGLYSARNYSSSLISQLFKRGVNIKQGISDFEDRFMAEADKDFLLIIVDSMQKGQHVQIKKVQAMHDKIQRQKEQTSQATGPSAALSAQDKQNIVRLHEMFGRSKQFAEKIYLAYDRNFDATLEQFLTGNLPQEETEELQVIIKPEDQSNKIVSTTYNEIQEKKKKQDLRKYILDEYSDILGPGPGSGVDQSKLRGQKYYQNHLKALELMQQEE